MKKRIILLTISAIISMICCVNAEFFPSKDNLPDISETANPDYPCFGFSYVGYKMHGIFGSAIPIYGDYSDDLRMTLSILPFVELHNFGKFEPVPWQMWRGSFGINSSWELPKLNNSRQIFKKITGEFGIIHESDHFTALNYVETYTTLKKIDDFDNANFSSFEYINMKIYGFAGFLPESTQLTLSLGSKLFLRSTERKLLFAYNFECIFKEKISKDLFYYISLFYENINNNFVSSDSKFQIIRNKEPLTYFTVHFGIEILSLKGADFQIFAVTSASNGRGLDFPDYGYDIGFGIRIIM